MPDESVQEKITSLHETWSVLPPNERPNAFWRYVSTEDRKLFVRLHRDPSPLKILSRRMQADWKGERVHEVRAATIRQCMSEIVGRYLDGQHDATTFQSFLNHLVSQCSCDEDLQRLFTT